MRCSERGGFMRRAVIKIIIRDNFRELSKRAGTARFVRFFFLSTVTTVAFPVSADPFETLCSPLEAEGERKNRPTR